MLAALLVRADVHAQTPACAPATPLKFETTGKIARERVGFTQGLEFRDGKLFESTGSVGGTTQLNVISLDGKVTTLTDLGTSVFGEGLTILNNEIFQLTWQEKQVFVYDVSGKRLRAMHNPRDGWGLANDGKQLLFTDGEGELYFADPQTFAITASRPIRSGRNSGVRGVNELEYVRGKLYANIFMTWLIVRLDPGTGCIEAVADLKSLFETMTADEKKQLAADGNNVLNGIAFDAAAEQFYVTGKRWKAIYVGKFVPASPP